ncbi:putative membrane protein [Plasmodium gaboni]|uniref:Putative membrane protein n=1 Tax=Plasmodium gaboni TaxID=647221 RepID=A0A151LPW4_9APIC|nr:putative membrane protein [Plasmodium gaboni]KYO01270.1 putative membrane protein [Plasmodium gaboni]
MKDYKNSDSNSCGYNPRNMNKYDKNYVGNNNTTDTNTSDNNTNDNNLSDSNTSDNNTSDVNLSSNNINNINKAKGYNIIDNNNNNNILLGNKMNCKYVSYECEHILFLSSFQLSFSFIFSMYCQFYYLSIINMGLFVTSILHWRKPELGLRRNIDIAMMLCSIIIHIIYSFYINSLCVFICFFTSVLLASLYFIGKKFSYNSYSTLYHLFIHTIGNLSAITIYYISKKKYINNS